MTSYKLPLVPGAQEFTITLAGVTYRIRLVYRNDEFGGAWYIDMVRLDGTDSLLGIPLVIGADLLEQFQYKGFGHLVVEMSGSNTDRPNYTDIGNYVNLIWSD